MASAVGSILYGAALWIWGASLAVLDALLGGILTLGRAAGRARGRVKKARRTAHGKMGERI
jgi:hypothetical protein